MRRIPFSQLDDDDLDEPVGESGRGQDRPEPVPWAVAVLGVPLVLLACGGVAGLLWAIALITRDWILRLVG